MQALYQASERRALRVFQWPRSTHRQKSVADPQLPLRLRLRELATSRVAYGYRRLHVLLRREGWQVNHKRVYRLYRQEGLVMRRKTPRRRVACVKREIRPAALMSNECWSMDFVSDQLFDDRRVRVLVIIENYTRECLALEASCQDPWYRCRDNPGTHHEHARISETDQGGQWTGVYLEGSRPLGVLEPCRTRLQPTGQTIRQRTWSKRSTPGSGRSA